MGRPAMMRRLKEIKRAEKAQEKAGKKEQRKLEKSTGPQSPRKPGDEDPDIAGIVPGPQAPLE